MKKLLFNILRRHIPDRLRPSGYLTHLVQSRTSCSVRKGPFVGMRYLKFSLGSSYIPKLLGIYERELIPMIEEAIARHPKLVVDIGAAEGYYAVGLALRLHDSQVIAFEIEAKGQKAVREMAVLNSVETHIESYGKCEPADLAVCLANESRTLVVCDVEGYENILLDPLIVPALRNVAILVELHESMVPGVTHTLLNRFADSHRIKQIWQEPREREEFPWRTIAVLLLPGAYLDWAVSECRSVRMSWLWMIPNE